MGEGVGACNGGDTSVCVVSVEVGVSLKSTKEYASLTDVGIAVGEGVGAVVGEFVGACARIPGKMSYGILGTEEWKDDKKISQMSG